MGSRQRTPPQQLANDTKTPMAAALSSNKIAELVRQLAESRYETQQLRQRMEMFQQEKTLPFAATREKYCEGEAQSLLQPQERQKQLDVGASVAVNGADSGVSRSFIEKGKYTNWQLSQSQKLQQPSQHDSDEMLLSSSSRNLCREAAAAAQSADMVAEQDKQCLSCSSSLRDDMYWKKKYAKLKRFHQKKLEERDMQLAEVQNLVFKLHEEYNELRHNHEQNNLRKQLEVETKGRLLLEAKAKTLEEEVLELQQRFGRLLEKPSAVCNSHVVSPEMALLPPGGASDVCRRQFCNDGLNQTDRSFLHMDAQFVAAIDTETLLPSDSRSAGTIEQNKGAAEQIPPRQLRRQIGEHVFAASRGLRESNGASPQQRSVAASRRSIALQVEVPTATTASQTEECGQRSVGLQVASVCSGDDDGYVREGFLRSAKGPELVPTMEKDFYFSCGKAAALTQSPRSGGIISDKLRGKAQNIPKFQALQLAQQKNLEGHLYYSVNGEEHAESKSNVRSIGNEGARGPLRDHFSSPITAPSCFSAGAVEGKVDCVSGGDETKRQRLDEDIRKHDQLLAAVAKLQRRVQRAARTPSF